MTDDIHPINAAALWLAKRLQHLGTGDLAQLRRIDASRVAPAFWKLCSQEEEMANNETCWMPIVAALSALTPRGDPVSRRDLHDRKRKLGTCLCDGGIAGWAKASNPQPLLSELRLARLSSARGAQRTNALLRAVRMLAASREPGMGVDVADLAWRFLDRSPDPLNRAYYAKLYSVPSHTAPN